MIRGDNACALLSYCFKPFANSEEASLNSRLGGSEQAERRAAFSSTGENSHCRHEMGGFPNQFHPAKGRREPLFGTWALTGRLLHPLGCPSLHGRDHWPADQGWHTVSVKQIPQMLAPQLCFHFLGVNTHSVHLLFKWHFPLCISMHSTVLSCYFRLFHTLFRIPIQKLLSTLSPTYLF